MFARPGPESDDTAASASGGPVPPERSGSRHRGPAPGSTTPRAERWAEAPRRYVLVVATLSG